jgi:hypothetical protein
MLESLREAGMIRPLFRVWETTQDGSSTMRPEQALSELLEEQDDWLRACAHFSKEEPMETLTTLSIMERILFLRRVPLLTALNPTDLQRVAAIATELDFVDGESLCEQGETGNEMFVIVLGEVRVVVHSEEHAENEIARRGAGDVVGEMSLISGDTRIASVIAAGEVRALCIDRLNFESLLRERPEVSLEIMRELCQRVKELSR